MLGICGGCVTKAGMTLLAPAVARPVQNVEVDFFVCLSLKRGFGIDMPGA
jgi:hypothetical protein